jgi:hypothetical protein
MPFSKGRMLQNIEVECMNDWRILEKSGENGKVELRVVTILRLN